MSNQRWNYLSTTIRNWASNRTALTVWLLILALPGCTPPALRDDAKSVHEYYRTHDQPEFRFSKHGPLTLRYIETGDPGKTTVVFVHGTPGNWAMFASYVNDPALQLDAHMISFDRPGWGGSTFTNGNFEPGIEAQSKLLGDWLCDLFAASGTGELILVGHSLGGTLAPRLAMDHPDCVTGMLLLAGPLDPDLASPRWYNEVARVPPFGWLADIFLGGGMRQSNKEMMILKPELEKMRPLWASLNMPVILIQGGKDQLVNPDHAAYAEKMLAPEQLTVIRLANDDHFFLFSNKALVLQQIRSLLATGTVHYQSTLGNVDSEPAL